jgi:hypothetical protein
MESGNLRECLRAFTAGAPDLPPLDAAGWAQAQAHRLAATVYHMRAAGGHEERQIAYRTWANQAAAHLMRCACLARNWPTDGPAPLLIKGADLAEHVYRDPGARRMSDLDVLVPAEAFESVTRALRRRADAVHAPRGEGFPGDPPYELGFVFGDVTLEVHRALQPFHRGGPDPAALYRRSTPGMLEGLPIRVPGPMDRVLVWLTNQCKGSFQSDLADALDLALILRALPHPRPYRALATSARREGLERALALAVRRLGAAGIFPEALPALPDWDDRLVARLLPDIDTPALDQPAWQFQAIKLWLAPVGCRGAIVRRGAYTAVRRLYNQVSGTKTMSPG